MSEERSVVQQMLDLGEERMGDALNQLLANETFVSAMQRAVSSSLSAKRTFDTRLGTVLTAVNVPTLEDVDELRGKLEELEDVMAEIEDRVKRMRQKQKASKKAANDDDGGGKKVARKATKKTAKKKPSKKKKAAD